MTLRDAMHAVYERHGKLTPDLVVAEARAADTPEGKLLHDRLEWDDAVAGEAHRRQQASDLIRCVRIVYRQAGKDGPERTVRAFQCVRSEDGYAYHPAEAVVLNPLQRKILMRDMERDIRALYARYGQFKEFAEMISREQERLAAVA